MSIREMNEEARATPPREGQFNRPDGPANAVYSVKHSEIDDEDGGGYYWAMTPEPNGPKPYTLYQSGDNFRYTRHKPGMPAPNVEQVRELRKQLNAS